MPFFKDKRRNAAALLRTIGHRNGHARVGMNRVRNEILGTIYDPPIALPYCGGTRTRCVGAGARLRQSPGPEVFTTSKGYQVFLPLFFIAKFINVV